MSPLFLKKKKKKAFFLSHPPSPSLSLSPPLLSVSSSGTYSTSNPSTSNLGSQDPSTFRETGSNHLELKLESIFWFSEELGSLKRRDWQHNKEGQSHSDVLLLLPESWTCVNKVHPPLLSSPLLFFSLLFSLSFLILGKIFSDILVNFCHFSLTVRICGCSRPLGEVIFG